MVKLEVGTLPKVPIFLGLFPGVLNFGKGQNVLLHRINNIYFFSLIREVFKDHPGQTNLEEDTGRGGKKKKGGGKTVSSFYKEQLTNLMTTLHATEPHFIR